MTAHPPPNLLELASVVKSNISIKKLAGRPILDRLDFKLAPGQVMGLLGRNGAGKSTLIECALGLRSVQAGTRTLLGEDPASLSESARARLGYVPQQVELFGWMTAPQMLGYFKAFYTRWNDDKVAALLDRWSVPCNTLIRKLSGGEQQRLAIIRALAHEPELLVLDEPVSSLDPAGRRDFLRELIDTVVGRGVTVLFSTHILTDLERVASDIAILHQGKLLLQQPFDALADGAKRISGSPETLDLLEQRLRGRHRVFARAAKDALFAAVPDAEWSVYGLGTPTLHVAPATLEDFFIEVTR